MDLGFKEKISMFTTEKSWVDGVVLEQLKHASQLAGVLHVAALPDVHPGGGIAVGTALLADRVYPHLIGNDIGCGMLLVKTNLKAHKLTDAKLIKKLSRLEAAGPARERAFETCCTEHGANRTWGSMGIGSVGGGNHFVELVKCIQADEQSGLNEGDVCLLVHSGSRGLGMRIFTEYQSEGGALKESRVADYLKAHDDALQWSQQNRWMLALMAGDLLDCQVQTVAHIWHNFIEVVSSKSFGDDVEKSLYLHRKGAASGDIVVVPGSRGSQSYLVKNHQKTEALFSLPHGAGRKWKRSECKAKLGDVNAKTLLKTKLGSVVICDQTDLLYEEAPEAYKNINQVISDVQHHDLGAVLAKFEPIATYKSASPKDD